MVGVDAHTDTHDACVLDDCGRLLGDADVRGRRGRLPRAAGVGWAVRPGRRARRGVDRQLRRGADPLPARRRRRGARGQPAAPAHPPAARQERPDRRRAGRPSRAGRQPARDRQGHHGIVEAIRQLRVARDGAVKARSAALNALGGLIVTAPEELRQQLSRARPRAAARRSARASGPTRAACTSRPRPPRPRCARSHAASSTSTPRSRCSTDNSKQLVAKAAPTTTAASPSPPATPARCWSPPGRTSDGCAAKHRSPRCAAPAPYRSRPVAPTDIASTTAATATPTARCT